MSLLCPYCQKPARRATGREVYPHRLDLAGLQFFVCEPCDARVGCHVHTGEPFGTLANAELRGLRQRCHNAFDRIWKRAPSRNQRNARTGAYAWLAAELDVSSVHFGAADAELCKRVLERIEFSNDLPPVDLLLDLGEPDPGFDIDDIADCWEFWK